MILAWHREIPGSIRTELRRFPVVELRQGAGHAGVPDNELVDCPAEVR